MKQTLTKGQAASILAHDRNNGFTYSGAYALCEYLEQLEVDNFEEIEFDHVAFRCDYSEHESLADWANDYFGADSDWRVGRLGIPADDYDTKAEESVIREYIQDHGQLIEFDGGIIVSSF